MVVFTCSHCGESLQKPRVEKHYNTTCRRNPKQLTCVDCLKDFRLEEYTAHTKCITETERYAAKGTVIRSPKGQKKQESWVETVHNLIEEQKSSVSSNIQRVFDLLSKRVTIPKKKRPFINFVTNASANKISEQNGEETWNILEKRAKEIKEQNSKKNNDKATAKTEESTENNKDGKKKKKKKSKKNKENVNGTKESAKNDVTNENTEDGDKSKKKRKSKHIETEAEDIPEKKIKVEETLEENSVKSSKKKKKTEKTNENNSETAELKIESNVDTANSKKKKSGVKENGNTNNVGETESIAYTEKSNKKKKRKSEENGETTDVKTEESPAKKKKNEENGTSEKKEVFSWEIVIREILEKKPDGIAKDKLENKVLKMYENINGSGINTEKIIKRFNKKLKSLQNVHFDNDKIKIVV